MNPNQYTPMCVAAGDARYLSVPGIVKPINCGSARVAGMIAARVNAHDALISALRIATATVELDTGNGAQEQPDGWPKLANGDIDVEAVAKLCREAIAAAKGDA